MPLVGNKHFAYTPEGMKKALAHAEKTGQKVKIDKKGIGGMVKKYSKGGMLKGPSHKKGGIPAVVKGSGQPIEMEGGEYVIKKDAAKKLGPDILNYINKTGSVPKMSNGGTVNPYLKDFRESEANMKLALDALPQEGSDEYADLERRKHSKGSRGVAVGSPTGEQEWRRFQSQKIMAEAQRHQAAKRAKEKAIARGGVSEFSGSSGLAARGGLRARADQKAAYKIIQEESKARKDAYIDKKQAEWDQKRAAWEEQHNPYGRAQRSWDNPYRRNYNPAMDRGAPTVYKHGGSINNIFSLLKKRK